MRAVLPPHVALGARITGTDWHPEGITIEEAVAFADALKKRGVAYACVSGGGNGPGLEIPLTPGYQVPFAEDVRKATGLVTRAVGLITDPHHAEDIVAAGKADTVALARAFLDDPRWVWRAADTLGAKIDVPPQYERARPPVWCGSVRLAG